MTTKRTTTSRISNTPVKDVPYSDQPAAALAEFHYLGIAVDLFLDDQRQVHLTQVYHSQTNEGRAWTGWDERRLLNFLQQQIKTNPTEMPEVEASPQPVMPAPRTDMSHQTKTAKAMPAVPVAPSGGISQRMRRRLAALVPEVSELMHTANADALPTSNEPALIIRSGESFDAPMPDNVADFDSFAEKENLSYRYSAAVYAKRCEDNARLLLDQQQGTLATPDAGVKLMVSGQNLSRGLYRLHTSLAVTAQPAVGNAAPITHTALRSSLLQVV